MTTTPPFRADHVGSLLRPPELREAREKARAGAITAAQLREVEDRCIREAVAKQESIGLRVVTDGEYRRDFWHLDFLRQLGGVGLAPIPGMKFKAEDAPPMPTVTGPVRCSQPIMADDFRYLRSVARAAPKLSIPAPAMLHLRGGRSAISREHYPDLAAFWQDAAAAYRAAIGHIAAAGCAYLQLDDVSFSYLCDPAVREGLRAAGDDPATLPRAYADAINGALADRPAGMTVAMHTCRGNFRSTWLATGGYEDAVVEAMFSTSVDAYFMEWDSDRAGGFEPPAPPASRQARGARARHHQVGSTRAGGRDRATHRRGGEAGAAGAPCPLAAVRVREHPPRQPAHRGRAVAQARARRPGGAPGLGRVTCRS